jgi:N-acetylglucosamine repressor
VTSVERPAKATLRETREHNERLVLATIYDEGPLSRADVARRTGLTRTTVSDVVEDLLAGGLVVEIGRGPSTGGKAPILLQVDDNARQLIGVDLGEGVFRGATVDLRGEILQRIEVPAGESDGEAALERAFDLIDQLLASAPDQPILGIGIGAPGLIDTVDGTVIQAVKIDWRNVPLGRLVRERYGLPVYVANDSQVAALAEHVFGDVRAANLVSIKVGQGIGAGLVLNGELFQGDGFGAGEIGHTTVVPNGDLCRCGSRGCLETVASTRAVLAAVSSGRGRAVTLDEALADFRRGDPFVGVVVRDAGARLGLAVAALVGALNVHRIVLAGAMAAFGDEWLAAVRDVMCASALPALAQDTTLELGGIDDIVVLGASALLMTRELGLSFRPSRARRRGAEMEEE